MTGEETQDGFLGGRLRLIQPARGHRVGTDAALLAAGVAMPEGGVLFDLGAGVGAAGLAVALRHDGVELFLVEIDPVVAELARRNSTANGLADRAHVIEADLACASPALKPGQADVVMMNPPYNAAGTTRRSPQPYRARAHVAAAGGDEAWLRRAASLLRPGGWLVAIHRADALARLLPGLTRRFGDIRILPILPRQDAAATRILVRARRASRAPLAILPALVLHGEDGAFTPLAAALHAGTATIDWKDGGTPAQRRAPRPGDQ